ncbi:MAG: hypothetical protein ABIS01_03540 [Ferruginibacter sp.]
MKKKIFIAIFLFTVTNNQLSAQTTNPQKPVKTGNEWKMPSDVFKRSKAFAGKLQKELGLDTVQTKKVYDAYLTNTKPLDEISVQPISEKEKEAEIKANKAAFNETLKVIFTAAQYSQYLHVGGGK